MNKTSWIGAVLLCGMTLALAQEPPADKPTAETAPPTWRQEQGNLRVLLLLTTTPGTFLEAWSRTRGGIPRQEISQVRRGVTVVSFVAFSGCKADVGGFCNAMVDFTVLKPDGTVYAEVKDRELWRFKEAPPLPVVQLGVGFLRVTIEDEDPLGTYTIQAVVRDLNSGASLPLEDRFLAVEEID